MMSTIRSRLHVLALLAIGSTMSVAAAQAVDRVVDPDVPEGLVAPPNPYRLEPFHDGFPVELEYPPHKGLEFVHTRRQMLQQLAANLQGNVRREAWQMATEFFWRAPEDAAEPLIEAMDRAMGNPALGDVVKNCVEAMGKMGLTDFDDALKRALQHKSEAVRQSAYLALGTCAAPDTLRRLGADFVHMDGRARGAWLRAVRTRLPEDRVEILTGVMMADFSRPVRDQVIKEVLQLPVAEAAVVLRGSWQEAVEDLQAIIAGVLHAAGDPSGTAWLHDALGSEDTQKLTRAIRYCAFGDDPSGAIGELREDLLRTTTHLRPEVRLEAVKVLVNIDGDDVSDVLEVLSSPGEVWDIRAIALRELTRRGRDQAVTVLLDELPTATGTRLQSVINQLSASGDARAVPVLRERFEKAPDGEGRPFLQALAQNASPAAARALCELFAAPDRLVARANNGDLTTRTYLPTLLLNLRGPEAEVLAMFRTLEPEQWQLRARLLPTIAGYAKDRWQQQELRDECLAILRGILFDRDELPQMRVLSLNLMARNWLTVEEALKLKNMRRDEQPGMRVLLGDFLHDFF